MQTIVVGLNVREAQAYAIEHRDKDGFRPGDQVRIVSAEVARTQLHGLDPETNRIVVLHRAIAARHWPKVYDQLRVLKARGLEIEWV